jgi:CheY-like chemotaxis protein
MTETLGHLGYEAEFASDGASGLRAPEQARPLAVVLDLVMPGMDGFAFLDRFQQLSHCRGVPVIIWTMKALLMKDTPTSGPINSNITHQARDARSSRHSFTINQTKADLAIRLCPALIRAAPAVSTSSDPQPP